MADRYTEEALRLAGMLKTLAKSKRRSIRSLEQQMGVGTSMFHKVLKGDVTLQLRHLLMIADALEVDWTEFFQMAYPRAGAPAVAHSDSLLEDLDHVLGEPAEREISDAEFEERVKRVLAHLGLLPGREDAGDEEHPELRIKSA
jgi:transcriptional regulator with XRE-family HTH domain